MCIDWDMHGVCRAGECCVLRVYVVRVMTYVCCGWYALFVCFVRYVVCVSCAMCMLCVLCVA